MGERRIGNLLLNGTGTPARVGQFVQDCYGTMVRLFTEDETMRHAVLRLAEELMRRETICGKHAVEIVREYL